MDTPDDHALGFAATLDPLRYDWGSEDPLDVSAVLQSMMPSGVRVLDVGCGTGSVTLIANRDRGNAIHGIEPDPQRAAVARSRGLIVHTGYLDEAFLSDNDPFDVAVAADVLEHTSAPAEVLQLMVRAIKPNGIILISVPNVAHWSVRLNLLMGRFDYEPVGIMDATHLRWFTCKTIRSLIEFNGLHVVEVCQTAGISLPVYSRGILRRIRGKRYVIPPLTKMMPLLFGVQHVVKAVKPARTSTIDEERV
jgi:methionine biosynthesis protein MetW